MIEPGNVSKRLGPNTAVDSLTFTVAVGIATGPLVPDWSLVGAAPAGAKASSEAGTRPRRTK